MEPVLIATKADHTDLCAVVDFTLDMVIGHDRQDFTASFDPIEGVGGGSLLYIDGTEYGGVVDDVTTDTETGIASYHGRTWDGVLAAKRIMPPSGSAYRTVSGEANGVLASLVTLLDLGGVFAASTAPSGITISSYQFDRFVDAYEGIYKMLQSAGAKLVMHRENGVTVMEAKAAATISDEADSDLLDFMLTKTSRTVNHLVCAGEGEGTARVVLHLYADVDGTVSTTQTQFGIDEVTDFYDYNNADATELLEKGTEKLAEYQTKGAVEITSVGRGAWDVGDTLVARDNRLGIVVSAPIVGKTVKVDSSTNWELSTSYEVGEVSRTAATVSGNAEHSYVFGVKGNAEINYRSGNVNLTPANIGAVETDGGNVDAAAFCSALHVGDYVAKDQTANVSMADSGYTNVCSISLAAGLWIVNGIVRFATNATGRRQACISTFSSNGEAQGMVSANAVSGSYTYLNATRIIELNATTTLYLTGYQTSGAALNATGYLRAVRIK